MLKNSKVLVILVLLFLLIIFGLSALSINNKRQNMSLTKYNMEYNKYLNKTINGTELATLINKAINQNDINKIEKNEKNYYIENETDSIKIEIRIEQTKKTYSMEEFYNNDTSEFVKFFSDDIFTCTSVEYHKSTGKISKMYFEQV